MIDREGVGTPFGRRNCSRTRWHEALLWWLLSAMTGAGMAAAVVCTVPGTYPTIGEAVGDPTCTEIQLGAQSHPESVVVARSLVLTGPASGSAVIEGRVSALGVGTVVEMTSIDVESGCPGPALTSSAGARLEPLDVSTLRSETSPCNPGPPIFEDGFESGDTSAWTTTVGGP